MIPLQIQLKNFMSYRSPVTVDFRGIGTACLSGANGAGKSALLEAMTWAVWGKCRAPGSRDVVTLGESQVEVTFDFLLGDREYRVFRRQTIGNRMSSALEFYVRSPGSEDWHTITADNVRETDRKIIAMLKMDYETFVNSAFLMQGQADTFTRKRPGERKKVLADILNLGDYDVLSGMARDEERSLRGRANNLTAQITRLDESLSARPAVEAELETLSAGLIEASGKLESLESEQRALQDALSALSALLRNRSAIADRLTRQEQQLAQARSRLDQDKASVQALATLIGRGDAIEQAYRDLQAWRKTSEEQAQTLSRRQPVETKLREVERSIELERVQLERTIDRLAGEIRQSTQAVTRIASAETELEGLRKEITSAAGLEQEGAQLQSRSRAVEAERTSLESECKSLRASMQEIKANLDLLASGSAECPVCRRPMGAGEHEHVEALWTNEGTKLGDTFRKHRNRIKVLDKVIPELAASLAEVEKQSNTISQKQAIVRRLESEVAGKSELEATQLEMRSEQARLQKSLESKDCATDLWPQVEQLQATLKAMAYDAGLATRAQEEVKRLANAEREHTDLQTARIRVAALEDAIAKENQTVADLEVELVALRQEQLEIGKQLEGEPDIKVRLAKRGDEIDRVRTDRDEIQSRFGAANNRIAELDRLADEIDALRAELERTTLDADAYRELATAFGRNGIQAMIVETILPELEDEANRLLARMTTSHLHVRLRSTRQAISNDNIIETLDIIIRDESGERPYALYSGGESFRIDFALRVALSKLLVRRAGTTIDMLIIDEGFGTQDQRGRDGLVEALQSVESDFATILVITHIDDVRDMFPRRIEVTKTDAGSSVNVI